MGFLQTLLGGAGGLLSGLAGAGSVASGAAGGAASERDKQNQFITNANSAANQQYGTQQNAMLSSLLGQSNEASNRYGTQQGATTNAMQGLQGATTHALDSQSAENLDRAKLKLSTGLTAPTIRARQSILGSAMANMQPHSFTSPTGQTGHLTNVTGGLSAANLDPTTRAQGQEMIKQAMEKQLNGEDIDLGAPTDFMSGIQDWKGSVLNAPGATDYSKAIIAPPEMQDYEKAGKMETGLSMGGLVASLLGQLGRGGDGADGNAKVSPNVYADQRYGN